MAVFDANILILLLDPDKPAPLDPTTGKPVTHARTRIEHLVDLLEESSDRVLVPTPALSELLVGAALAGPDYLRIIESRSVFVVAPFDKRCAVELAEMSRSARDAGEKSGGSQEPWQKVKLDRQIVAIAKVNREQRIYSTDVGVLTFARRAGLQAFSLADIQLPPDKLQSRLPGL